MSERRPIDPEVVQYFYLPAMAFIVTMVAVGIFTISHRALWPVLVGAGMGIVVGAIIGH